MFPLKKRWVRKPPTVVGKSLSLGFDYAVLFNRAYRTLSVNGTQLIPTPQMLYDTDGAANFSGGNTRDSAVEVVGAPILDGEVTIVAEIDLPTDFGGNGRYFIGNGGTGTTGYSIAFVSATVLRFYQGNSDIDVTVPTMSGRVRIAITRRGSTGSWVHHVSVNGSPVKSSTTETTNPNATDRSVFIGRFGLEWNVDLHYRDSMDFIALKYKRSSDAELRSLSKNPYQILPSATQFIDITTAAPPPTGVIGVRYYQTLMTG